MLLNRETGELVFLDGSSLGAGVRMEGLGGTDDLAVLSPRPCEGGTLLPVCEGKNGALCAVTLYALTSDATKQRAALFCALQLADPCPDTRLCVRLGCAFGELQISTEPYFGRSRARIEYRESEAAPQAPDRKDDRL